MAANPIGEEKSPAQSRGVTPARVAAIAALAVVVIALGVVLFGGGGEHKYTLLFQNASQLVPDNQVLIGGQPVGSVESIGLTDDNLAEVKISSEQELHEGTTAVIRATSLSGVANHYVSISPGPNDNPALDEGATLGLSSTTTPADLDQLFNTFPPEVRRGLEQLHQGQLLDLRRPRAQPPTRAYKYFGPALNRTNAFVGELNADERLLERFVVSTGEALDRDRRPQRRALERHLQRHHRLQRDRQSERRLRPTLRQLPPVFRQANTTFVNLRAALDDLDPLVETAKPATKNLAPFLAELRPVVSKAVPVFKNLRLTVRRPGKAQRRQRAARGAAVGAAAVLEGVPALRSRDRGLPAQPQLRPRLHAGHLQRVRQARPGHRLLRRQRPLRAHLLRRPQHLQLQRRRTETDHDRPNSTAPSAPRRGVKRPLPRRRHPAGRRRLQPVRRTAVRRLRRHRGPMQPLRPAARAMRSRKGLIAALALVAIVVAIVLIASGGSGGTNGYVVRAIFDNGSFMVKGEQVRVAGANVGEVESVGVTMPGEIDSYENGQPAGDPRQGGDRDEDRRPRLPGLQAGRQLHHPAAVADRREVRRLPADPAARAGHRTRRRRCGRSKSAEPGAGQHLLPLENNSTSVDPDLINDIHTLPYAQRFRLIFNELGAALAGRGSDIAAAVKRANPDLRDADRVLEILSDQRDQLAQLASDSEQILRPLSEQRTHVAGFLANAGAAGQATGERGAELEASLQKFPRFLREFRLDDAQPARASPTRRPRCLDHLDEATPALTEATRHLAPFTSASTVALKALGNAGEASGPIFAEADPVVKKARNLARIRRQPDDQARQVPGQHQADQGLGPSGRTDLQRRRRAQRIRPVRPLRAEPRHARATATNTNRPQQHLQRALQQGSDQLGLRRQGRLLNGSGRTGGTVRRHGGDLLPARRLPDAVGARRTDP